MAIRLVAVDVDGTLLTADQRVLPRVKDAVQLAVDHGIQLVLSTGRSAGECWYVLEQLPQIRYAVTYTGSMVQDLKTGAVLYHCPLQADDLRIIYDRLRQYDGLWSLFADGKVYNPRAQMAQFGRYYPEELRELFEHSHTYIDDMDRLIAERTEPVEKVDISYCSKEESARARAAAAKLPYYATGAGFADLEVMNPATNKGLALGALAEALGIAQSEVLAIGDSSNDAAMLAYAGVGVAMANGEEELKKIADRIAPSNEAGGVADILEMAVRGDL